MMRSSKDASHRICVRAVDFHYHPRGIALRRRRSAPFVAALVAFLVIRALQVFVNDGIVGGVQKFFLRLQFRALFLLLYADTSPFLSCVRFYCTLLLCHSVSHRRL